MIDALGLYAALVIVAIAGYVLVVFKLPSIKSQASGVTKSEIASSLPTWDAEWEHQDPVRGRAGWEVRDYVNIVVAIFLLTMSISLLIPAITVAREADNRIVSINRLRKIQFEQYERMSLPAGTQFP